MRSLLIFIQSRPSFSNSSSRFNGAQEGMFLSYQSSPYYLLLCLAIFWATPCVGLWRLVFPWGTEACVSSDTQAGCTVASDYSSLTEPWHLCKNYVWPGVFSPWCCPSFSLPVDTSATRKWHQEHLAPHVRPSLNVLMLRAKVGHNLPILFMGLFFFLFKFISLAWWHSFVYFFASL
jgi:hypothetical protein